MQVAQSIEEIIDLFLEKGRHHYDEDLSQLEHALQTAALATHAGAPEPLIAAALLHDVGHLLDLAAAGADWSPTDADLQHEASGARYLSGVFPPTVTAPIALHVRAKRYRTAADPAYLASLSAGSLASLARQGGPMNPVEAEAFEANPGSASAVELRGWDDGGKIDGLEVPGLDHYRALLERVAL